MRTRAIFSVLLLGFGATACTQILGIDDRTLRDDTATDDNGSPIGGDDGGARASGDGSIGTTDGARDGAGNVVDGGNDAAPIGDGASPEPAVAKFSVDAIDFGLVGCGVPGNPTRTLRIVNGGDLELDFSASLASTSTFTFDSHATTAGPIAGGAYADVIVSSAGVASFATAASTYSTTLTVAITIDGTTTTTDFPVTQTAAGASIEIDPASIAFGQVQTGSSSAANPIAIHNTGNLPISIGLGSPGDAQFSVANGGGFALDPGASSSGLSAMFTPSAAGPASSRISVLPGNTPICGAVPTGIDLSGTGTTGPIALQPGSLDFGLVDCAKQASAQQIQVTTTGAKISWTASLGKGSSSPYVISPTAGNASSATPGVITVTARAIPGSADVTADAFADTLTIVAPDGSHSIPLHETAHGAILSQSTTSIAFGGVNTGNKATSQFNIVNAGNASANVSYNVTDATFGISAQGVTVGGQGTSSVTTASFAPTATSTYSASATMQTTNTVLCAPLPKDAIALSGTGTKTYASVSPSSLDFGLVNCGGTGTAKPVTIANTAAYFSANITWTAVLGKGSSSPYKLSATTGTSYPQGSSSVTVTPIAIPAVSPTDADYYADTLTITTNAANDSPHVISLHETAQGAILALAPTALDFGTIVNGSTSTQSFQIVNTGNYPASKVSLALGSNTSYSLATSSNITVNGGSSVADTATFKPSKGSTGVKSTTVTPSFSGANCGGTPTPMTLTGTSS